jgi:hypothetical protein
MSGPCPAAGPCGTHGVDHQADQADGLLWSQITHDLEAGSNIDPDYQPEAGG